MKSPVIRSSNFETLPAVRPGSSLLGCINLDATAWDPGKLVSPKDRIMGIKLWYIDIDI